MSTTFNTLFFPVADKNYCQYFYFLSAINIVLFLFTLAQFFYVMVTSSKSKKFVVMGNLFVVGVITANAYFINRLFYSMCLMAS
jgi:hypothetical protein